MKAREINPTGNMVEVTLDPGEMFLDVIWPEGAPGTTATVVARVVDPNVSGPLCEYQKAHAEALAKAISDGLVVEPWDSSISPPGADLSVSSAQAMIQLSRMEHDGSIVPGATTLAEAVTKLVENSGDQELQAWFARAGRWVITNQNVRKIGYALKLDDEAIRKAFEEAAKIEE